MVDIKIEERWTKMTNLKEIKDLLLKLSGNDLTTLIYDILFPIKVIIYCKIQSTKYMNQKKWNSWNSNDDYDCLSTLNCKFY